MTKEEKKEREKMCMLIFLVLKKTIKIEINKLPRELRMDSYAKSLTQNISLETKKKREK